MRMCWINSLRVIAVASLAVAFGVPANAQFQGPPQTQPVSPSLTGPKGVPNVSPSEAKAMEPLQSVVIVPGDQLSISILGLNATLPSPPQVVGGAGAQGVAAPLQQTVNSDNTIQVSYIGKVSTAGLTPIQLSEAIAARLKDQGYILDPQVQVSITAAPTQTVTIQGDVKLPTVVPVAGQRTLLDMLAAAGGTNPTASHLITVHRQSSGETIQVLLDPNPANASSSNIPIYPGDSILVPRAGQIYVVGSVKTPMAVPIQTNTPLTLIQALSMAGGAQFEAALSKTIIIRTDGAKRKEIDLDVKKILKGTQPDPILQADDIVYLPGNLFKGAVKGGAATSALTLVYGIGYLAK